MRKLVLKMSMSVDGFVAGRPLESDWMFHGSTPDSAAWVRETLSGAGVHIAGRRLFETFVSFYPTSTIPMAAPMNDKPKVVFTRQAAYIPGAQISEETSASVAATYTGARVANGELSLEIERLKGEPGGYLLAQGGVEFARSLVQAGLVDEYRFAVLPVALGSGEGLFTGLQEELDLELISSTAFSGGALGNVFRPRR